ncbi:MAG: RNA polymerase sigma-70 factor [Tannerella sp.]|jgi:RNA polymerase sigma-70 factor (ECF subfamily)|nr:RNA polymerase sigma-70 factor [Tannerella sp.]
MKILKSNDKIFEEMYVKYFPKMVRFATEYLMSKHDAENVVQDLFVDLWVRHRETLVQVNKPASFLFKSLKNRSIDCHRNNVRARERHFTVSNAELELKMEALQAFDTNLFDELDVEEALEQAIARLPERCREVYIMSRSEGMKNEEIAEKLGISVNTVKNHLSAATTRLKADLKDYLTMILFIL